MYTVKSSSASIRNNRRLRGISAVNRTDGDIINSLHARNINFNAVMSAWRITYDNSNLPGQL